MMGRIVRSQMRRIELGDTSVSPQFDAPETLEPAIAVAASA
jgi:hypothetical protein